MKFGVALPISHQGVYLPTPFADAGTLVDLIQHAEKCRFSSAWGLDFMNPTGRTSSVPQWYEVVAALAFLAAKTSSIRVGTAPLQLPLRDPFLLARQMSTIDVLSGGRAMLGLRMGCDPNEFSQMFPAADASKMTERAEDYLHAICRFVSEGDVTIDSPHYRCSHLNALPKPKQRRLPIYLSDRSSDAPRRVAKNATGWLLSRADGRDLEKKIAELKKQLEIEGRPLSDIDLVVTRGIVIGKTREAALQRFRDSPLPSKMDSFAQAGGRGGVSTEVAEILDQNLIGTPVDIGEQLRELARKGVSHCILYYFAAREAGEMADQMARFSAEVMPQPSQALVH